MIEEKAQMSEFMFIAKMIEMLPKRKRTKWIEKYLQYGFDHAEDNQIPFFDKEKTNRIKEAN